MIVMSVAARKLLDKMKSYTSRLEYNVIDVEQFAHTYLLSTLEGWWKKKKSNNDGIIYNSHEWFLPKCGSADWHEFYEYTRKAPPQKLTFELIWDDNLEQVYHYLCGSVLQCDFGVEEFRRITEIAIHPLRKVQIAAEKAKGSCRGVINTPYILGILEREEQAKEIESERTRKKIINSQRGLVRTNFRRATSLEATLMKAQLNEIRMCRYLEKCINEVVADNIKKSYSAVQHALMVQHTVDAAINELMKELYEYAIT